MRFQRHTGLYTLIIWVGTDGHSTVLSPGLLYGISALQSVEVTTRTPLHFYRIRVMNQIHCYEMYVILQNYIIISRETQ
jgi:hypothetical protein